MNDAPRELGRPIENARFNIDTRFFVHLHRSTAVAINAHAWCIAAVANFLRC
jgi:hypothetical protein